MALVQNFLLELILKIMMLLKMGLPLNLMVEYYMVIQI